MGNETKYTQCNSFKIPGLHFLSLLQEKLICAFQLLSGHKGVSGVPLCLFPLPWYYFLHGSRGGRCARYQCLALVPQLRLCRCFRNCGLCQPGVGGAGHCGIAGSLLHWFTFLMLLLFSCLCVPEGWHSPPEVEWRGGRERTGEMG